MNFFQRIKSELHAESVPLSQVAREVGTPCYVYSRAAVEHNYGLYVGAFADYPHQICYAVKANSNIAVLNLLARLGSGFDIVSVGELERVLHAGGDPSRVVFSGVAKSRAEIVRGLQAGVGCFDVESVQELERVSAVAVDLGQRAAVAVRVNPDVDAETHPYIATGLKETKFGVAYGDAVEAYRRAAALPNIDVVGVAAHIGSQIKDSTPFLDSMERLLDLVDVLAAQDIPVRHLDVGGGLAVRYQNEQPPSIASLVSAYVTSMRRRGCDLPLLVEPGRSIVGDAGVLLTRVEYLKRNGDKSFCVVDAGMNDILRPSLYQAWHQIVPVDDAGRGREEYYDVVGPVCESADVLGRDRELAVESGDLLAVTQAGGYGFVMSSNYNSRPRPAEVMVDGDRFHIVRPRQPIAELYAGETPLPE